MQYQDEFRRLQSYAERHGTQLTECFGFGQDGLMPPVLMQLMRHESIQTTQEFYVGRNAEAAADVVWEAFDGLKNQVQVSCRHHQENYPHTEKSAGK